MCRWFYHELKILTKSRIVKVFVDGDRPKIISFIVPKVFMRIAIAFTGITFCLLFCMGQVYGQKKASRLVSETRYRVYVDAKGTNYYVPIDSVHYGYSGNRESEVKCAYNNTIDTDKYPEMAYLPDPGFYDIYPSNCDTAMKFENAPDSSLAPRWNMTYLEADLYNEHNNPDKKFDLLNRSVALYKYDDKQHLISNHIYLYKKGTDSSFEAGRIQYGHDDIGRMSSREFIPANMKDSTVPILYEYDLQGRMAEVRSPHRTVSFTYDSSDKKTKVITMQITEANSVAEPQISVRCSYEYDHGNVVRYAEEKYDSTATAWGTIVADTITYDDKHRVTSFKDGETGLYHNYKIHYNTQGQAVSRTADETGTGDIHKLPDGTVTTLARVESRYYYEAYVPNK